MKPMRVSPKNEVKRPDELMMINYIGNLNCEIIMTFGHSLCISTNQVQSKVELKMNATFDPWVSISWLGSLPLKQTSTDCGRFSASVKHTTP